MRTRRALVLANETSRHPFRQTLPPHVLLPIMPDSGALVAGPRRFAFSLRDCREFLMAYCAMFLAVSAFIY